MVATRVGALPAFTYGSWIGWYDLFGLLSLRNIWKSACQRLVPACDPAIGHFKYGTEQDKLQRFRYCDLSRTRIVTNTRR